MRIQPKPSSKKYDELITEIEKGFIKIPKFQRNFIWSLEKTAKLLDSILKGYPIGTFILRETSEKLNEIKNIGDSKISNDNEYSKIQYVLDGQQRITSLYAVYKGIKLKKKGEKKITDYKNIFVDLDANLESGEDIITINKPQGEYISLHKLLTAKYSELKTYSENHIDKIQEYKEFFNNYDFSIVLLRKEDIDTAIEVFTRINTGGQTLTLFEIIAAKTYDENKKFDMEESFYKLINELREIGYETISNTILLYSIAVILNKNKECKRKTILQLKKEDIINIRDDVINSLKNAIDYFRSVYRIPVSNLLPYDLLLVPFTYFFYKQKNGPIGTQIKYLEEFFWQVSLSYRYSSATESKLSQDIKKIDLILNFQKPDYSDTKIYIQTPEDLINIYFSTGNSLCKAILSILAYQQPKNFITGGDIILDNSWLKVNNSKNYHHFFPKSYLKKNNIGNENSIVNITLVNADLNKRLIRSKAPSIYIKEFLDKNKELPKILKTHLITDIEEFGILSNDYKVFLQKRANVIFKEIQKRLNPLLENSNDNIDLINLIKKGENEKLEFKSSLRYDYKTKQINKILEFVIAKTIAAFLNTEGGTLLIGVDDEGNILGLENDYKTLSKNNKDGFELHLRNIIKKFFGESLTKYIKIDFPQINNKEICQIKVYKSGKPIIIKNDNKKEEFFIRSGNSTISLNLSEYGKYIQDHRKIN